MDGMSYCLGTPPRPVASLAPTPLPLSSFSFYANFNCVFLDCGPITIGDRVLLGPAVQVKGQRRRRQAPIRACPPCAAGVSLPALPAHMLPLPLLNAVCRSTPSAITWTQPSARGCRGSRRACMLLARGRAALLRRCCGCLSRALPNCDSLASSPDPPNAARQACGDWGRCLDWGRSHPAPGCGELLGGGLHACTRLCPALCPLPPLRRPRCELVSTAGITIGEGSTVAAGAVVTKDVQPFTVVRRHWQRENAGGCQGCSLCFACLLVGEAARHASCAPVCSHPLRCPCCPLCPERRSPATLPSCCAGCGPASRAGQRRRAWRGTQPRRRRSTARSWARKDAELSWPAHSVNSREPRTAQACVHHLRPATALICQPESASQAVFLNRANERHDSKQQQNERGEESSRGRGCSRGSRGALSCKPGPRRSLVPVPCLPIGAAPLPQRQLQLAAVQARQSAHGEAQAAPAA